MRSARTRFVLLAAGGSLLLLLGAFAFQYLGGLAPCKLCLWQRWPHALAVVAGALAIGTGGRLWPALGLLAALIAAGLGGYHAGIEQGWWEGPSSCTGGAAGLSGLTGADLLSTDTASPVVMCDAIAWQMLGLSMAGWNMVISLLLAGLWAMALRRTA